MNTILRSSASMLGCVVLLSACSGNMGSGSGVTPPVSAPAAGPVGAQSVASAPVPVPAQATTAPQLNAAVTTTVAATMMVSLPQAAGFGGTLCIGPASASSFSCTGNTPAPDASATPTPIPTAAVTPGAVLITPRPKNSNLSGLHISLISYPTSAPLRDDAADDGATNPLMVLDLDTSTALTMNGLDAFRLTLPKDQASSEHHYSLVLFDHDQRSARGSGIIPHKKTLHGSTLAVSAELDGTSLQFVDNATPLSLLAKHHYSVVLYTDTVTPTPGPTMQPQGQVHAPASAAPAAIPTSTASALPSALGMPTPFVTYPNGSPSP